MKEKEVKNHKPANKFYIKLAAIHALNVALIMAIFVFLGKIPGRAEEIKNLRNHEVQLQENTDVAIIEAELNTYVQEIGAIENSFVTESDLLVFIESLDRLKQAGLIASFEPLTTSSVTNRKTTGFPLLITFSGSPEHVAQGIAEFQKLPFLFKPVTAEVSYSREDRNTEFKYGIFLYQKYE